MNNNKSLSYGIVGAGFIASNVHLPILCTSEGINVTSICDEDLAQAHKVADNFHISKVYGNLDEMLENETLDVVDVLTPPSSHMQVALKVLKAGCNCLIEKPLTTKTADADALIDASKQNDRILHVIHNFSFMPCMRKAKRIIETHDLGDSVSVDVKYLTSLEVEMQRYAEPTHWCHSLPGDIFYDLSPHLIMLLLDFLDNPKTVKTITAKLSDNPNIKWDELRVIVEAENGVGTIAISFNSPARSVSIDVVKTKGRLFLNADNQIVTKYSAITPKDLTSPVSKGLRTLSEVNQQLRGLASNTFNSVTKRYGAIHKESHGYLIRQSIKSMQGQGVYPVDLWKAREVVRLLEAIFGSPT
ncbi:MAG: Gfo/Idh/MocA family protein [Candidatus Bathyarchaeia archaeon]|jgi:predicted dehydrogenase